MVDESVTLCVVNWNGAHYLPQTLRAGLEQNPPPRESLLVDNASTDGSRERVAALFPEVRILALERNAGPGAARNAGLRAAGSRYVLCVDNDVVLEAGCLARLLDAVRTHSDAVAAMPRVVYAERPDTIQFDGADAHYLGLMTLHHADVARAAAGEEAGCRRIGSLVSACFLVDRERLADPDPFEESFFIYLEDHDMGLRMRGRGHGLLAVPSALCAHRGGTPGLSLRPGGDYPPRRARLLIRNRWQVLLRNYELRSLLLLGPMLLAYEGFQLAGALAKGWGREWLAAFRWTVAHRRRLAEARAGIQAARVLADRELLCGGGVPFHAALATNRLERTAIRLLDRLVSGYWRLVRRLL